jgi:hypothetical protein
MLLNATHQWIIEQRAVVRRISKEIVLRKLNLIVGTTKFFNLREKRSFIIWRYCWSLGFYGLCVGLVDEIGTREMCSFSLSCCSFTFLCSRIHNGNMVYSTPQGLFVIDLRDKKPSFNTKIHVWLRASV